MIDEILSDSYKRRGIFYTYSTLIPPVGLMYMLIIWCFMIVFSMHTK